MLKVEWKGDDESGKELARLYGAARRDVLKIENLKKKFKKNFNIIKCTFKIKENIKTYYL